MILKLINSHKLGQKFLKSWNVLLVKVSTLHVVILFLFIHLFTVGYKLQIVLLETNKNELMSHV